MNTEQPIPPSSSPKNQSPRTKQNPISLANSQDAPGEIILVNQYKLQEDPENLIKELEKTLDYEQSRNRTLISHAFKTHLQCLQEFASSKGMLLVGYITKLNQLLTEAEQICKTNKELDIDKQNYETYIQLVETKALLFQISQLIEMKNKARQFLTEHVTPLA